ncbi:hypothetical protein GGI04_002173 [Coemansia thaxteri]|nr:hypothetical protein GGI04_002173 [Coemansia thaxteri]
MAGCPQERDDELSGGFEDDDFGGFGEEADEFGAEADEFGDFGSASPEPAEAPPEIAMLDIDKVRQIAGDSEETAPALLSQALHTVNALIADKEREVAKRRDAVLAYNQVIQTLVAQAAKLH